ncbi:DUF411 domain-containing protein [Nitrosomonas sp. Nm132]|jgi:hypothetical protein|uniref:DUF411 domain-containing protein n=1 Tax=Nitrosomonas sp. Nm132 TaxID=1881053 RepID=UPI0008865EE7|nr:Uncharacterized conserved protein [Nitrosomonas sp. Nm132]
MKIEINRFLMKSIMAGTLTLAAFSVSAGEAVEVYKSPTCGCCSKWIDHLRDHGFTVNAHDVGNKEARARAGISPSLGSCHTAVVNGYAIEGHVPAQDIKRLLKERPKAIGLAVPDMPHGTPGMEGARSDPYDVLLIKQRGDQRRDATVYSRYTPE